MPLDARAHVRAQVPAVRARYAAAGGDVEADVRDLGRGGAFIVSDTPAPLGARLDVELRIVGEASPIRAEARVAWVRASREGDRPAGMGIAFEAIDEVAADRIGALVGARERTDQGLGAVAPAALAASAAAPVDPTSRGVLGRERTDPGAPPAMREPTLVGVGRAPTPPVVVGREVTLAETPSAPVASGTPELERSIPLGLVVKKRAEPPSDARVAPAAPVAIDAPPRPRAMSLVREPEGRSNHAVLWAVAIVAVVGGGAAFALSAREDVVPAPATRPPATAVTVPPAPTATALKPAASTSSANAAAPDAAAPAHAPPHASPATSAHSAKRAPVPAPKAKPSAPPAPSVD